MHILVCTCKVLYSHPPVIVWQYRELNLYSLVLSPDYPLMCLPCIVAIGGLLFNWWGNTCCSYNNFTLCWVRSVCGLLALSKRIFQWISASKLWKTFIAITQYMCICISAINISNFVQYVCFEILYVHFYLMSTIKISDWSNMPQGQMHVRPVVLCNHETKSNVYKNKWYVLVGGHSWWQLDMESCSITQAIHLMYFPVHPPAGWNHIIY